MGSSGGASASALDTAHPGVRPLLPWPPADIRGFGRPNVWGPIDATAKDLMGVDNGGTWYAGAMYSLKEGPVAVHLPPFEGFWILEARALPATPLPCCVLPPSA